MPLSEDGVRGARTDATGACWTVLRAHVAQSALLRVHLSGRSAFPVDVRVSLRRPAGAFERTWLTLACAGAILVALALVLAGPRVPRPKTEAAARWRRVAAVALALGAGGAAFSVISRLPIDGGLGGLLCGELMVVVEIGLAVGIGGWLARGPGAALARREVLGGGLPRRGGFALALTPLAGTALAAVGTVLARSVRRPSETRSSSSWRDRREAWRWPCWLRSRR